MTADHVHDEVEAPSTWSIGQLRRHLSSQHGQLVPMAWNIGRLHQEHLEAHAPTKETPVPDMHAHDGGVDAFHAVVDRRSVAYHLENSHGLRPEQIDVRAVYSQHESLHAPKDSERVERLAEHLYVQDADGPQPDWDDLGQETRDRYRDRAREELAKPTVQQAPVSTGENPSILVDRLICALTGIDFDRDWVPDNGMGSSGRGVIRRTWIQPTQRLLDWLERGGALYLPAVASLSADVATLREQLSVTGGQLDEANQRLGAALEAGRRLEGQRNDSQAELRECKEHKRGLFEELGEARSELERIREDFRRVLREKQDLSDQVRLLLAKESVSTDLNAMAPISPDQAVYSDELPQINQPFKGLTLEVPPGTNRLMLSFVQEPEPEDKPLAAEPS